MTVTISCRFCFSISNYVRNRWITIFKVCFYISINSIKSPNNLTFVSSIFNYLSLIFWKNFIFPFNIKVKIWYSSDSIFIFIYEVSLFIGEQYICDEDYFYFIEGIVYILFVYGRSLGWWRFIPYTYLKFILWPTKTWVLYILLKRDFCVFKGFNLVLFVYWTDWI